MSRYVSSISKDGDSTTSVCNLIQSLTKQQQQVFSYVENFPHRWNSLCSGCVHCFSSFHLIPLSSVWLHLLYFPPTYHLFMQTDKICLSLLFYRLTALALSLSSYENCASPLIIFLALCWTQFSKSISFLYWGDQDWANWFAFW